MGLPLVPMTVSWPADTKLFVRGTTATKKRHSAHYDSGRSVCCQGRRWATWAAGGLHDHRPGRPLVPGGRPVQHRPAERVIDRVLAHEGIVRCSSVIALATQVPCRVLPLLGSVTG